MIQSFKHKGLRPCYETGNKRGIQTGHTQRLRMQLAALDTAQTIEDLDISGHRLHRLGGARKKTGSIMVSGNWRITFELSERNVDIVDDEDYH